MHRLRRPLSQLGGMTAPLSALAPSRRCTVQRSIVSSAGSPQRAVVSSNALSGTRGPPLVVVRQLLAEKDYAAVDRYMDEHFNPDAASLLDFCENISHARDLVLALMRSYVAIGCMEKVRRIFLTALRDLPNPNPPCSGASEHHPGACDAADLAGGENWRHPSLLNASVFNGYLEALTRRKNFDADEVSFVLGAMRAHEVAPDALTYHYLVELHIRAGKDPKTLWDEAIHEHRLRPLPATAHALLLRVVPSSPQAAFAVEVTREALKGGAAVMDKRMIAERIEQWLRGSAAPAAASAGGSAGSVGPSNSPYPPEYVMWLMLELELRCILDKASFVQYIQKQHVGELLLRCAKSADAATAAEVLALADRHVIAKTADILALVVWCWSAAGEVEKAFDMVELMARRGYLEQTDPMQKFHVDCLRYTMERHFLTHLADAISSPAAFQRAMAHVQDRRRRGLPVTVHALDVLVLAAGRLGDERQALQLALGYVSVWGVQPRTSTLNCLLIGCSAKHGSMLLSVIYEAMRGAGVQPNPLTFRTLIRQSVLNDCVDDAVSYLEEVSRHQGLRVEVEMVLPIMERAARVGDVDTVNRVSKFSLDCDIGIDTSVLLNVMKHLAEAGQSVEVLRGHQPLHEALRSRSKVGRQRVRSELAP